MAEEKTQINETKKEQENTNEKVATKPKRKRGRPPKKDSEKVKAAAKPKKQTRTSAKKNADTKVESDKKAASPQKKAEVKQADKTENIGKKKKTTRRGRPPKIAADNKETAKTTVGADSNANIKSETSKRNVSNAENKSEVTDPKADKVTETKPTDSKKSDLKAEAKTTTRRSPGRPPKRTKTVEKKELQKTAENETAETKTTQAAKQQEHKTATIAAAVKNSVEPQKTSSTDTQNSEKKAEQSQEKTKAKSTSRRRPGRPPKRTKAVDKKETPKSEDKAIQIESPGQSVKKQESKSEPKAESKAIEDTKSQDIAKDKPAEKKQEEAKAYQSQEKTSAKSSRNRRRPGRPPKKSKADDQAKETDSNSDIVNNNTLASKTSEVSTDDGIKDVSSVEKKEAQDNRAANEARKSNRRRGRSNNRKYDKRSDEQAQKKSDSQMTDENNKTVSLPLNETKVPQADETLKSHDSNKPSDNSDKPTDENNKEKDNKWDKNKQSRKSGRLRKPRNRNNKQGQEDNQNNEPQPKPREEKPAFEFDQEEYDMLETLHDIIRKYDEEEFEPNVISFESDSGKNRRRPYTLKLEFENINRAELLPKAIMDKAEISSLHFRVNSELKSKFYVEENTKILLAISGGVDSMVMLNIMAHLAIRNNFLLSVAHFNHKLRGEEAEKDAELVRLEAERLNIPFYEASGNVDQHAERFSMSIEQAARLLRYRFLERTAKNLKVTYVMTAHTADDVAETVLLNMLRGSGITGLSGIPEHRYLGKNVSIIRPMLGIRKQSLIDYANAASVEWREDASNETESYTRNKIRLNLMPQLAKDYNPSIVDVLVRSARLLRGADDYISDQVLKILNGVIRDKNQVSYSLKIDVLKTLTEFIKGEVIQASLRMFFNMQNVSLKIVDQILALINKAPGNICDINKYIHAVRDREFIIVARKEKVKKVNLQVNPSPGKIDFGPAILEISRIKRKDVNFSFNTSIEYFDIDKLPEKMILRNWEYGDEFNPLGMKGHMKLSDFLVNEKVSLLNKKKVVVLANEQEVIWALGFRIANEYKITSSTKNVLKIEIKKKNK